MKSPSALLRKNPIVAAFRRGLAPLAGSGRGLLGILALGLLLVVGGYLGWARWGGSIATRGQYRLSVDSFEITPQPPWIHSDIKTAVIRDGSLGEMSILDPDLTKRVVQAFELNTWVAEAIWAGKRPGKTAPRVIVKLRYREPVIMVRTRDARWKGDCFWPVDTEGVLLPPEEFSASQTSAYLRVEAGNSLPAGAVGTAYGDLTVVGAAKIAAILRGVWKPVGLEWIVVRKELSRGLAQPGAPTYLLFPQRTSPETVARRGEGVSAQFASATEAAPPALEVRWGHAPGMEAGGEASAAEKVDRLRQFYQEHGRLDAMPPTTILDLQPVGAMTVITDASPGAAPASPSPPAVPSR